MRGGDDGDGTGWRGDARATGEEGGGEADGGGRGWTEGEGEGEAVV